MEEVLYAGPVVINDFLQFITDCEFVSSAFVLCEQLPKHVITGRKEQQNLLLFTHFDPAICFKDYTSGRIFDEYAELRWEQQENTMQVVYLGSKDRVQTLLNYKLQPSKALNKLKPGIEKKYFLFGERIAPEDLEKIGSAAKPGDFAEVRIPRILRYPVQLDKQRYVRLVVREYCDEENRVMLFRFQDLKQWSSQS